ncbi:phosphodiesterase [Blastococcus sp. CT_GayMR19]|uniref:phosphodiesterase n=1 Tax=Blastococcus sp. CT_GayMR19 TaxID=2559608 RepID=UPI0010743FD0|nr:phosphodiesterase [Blastococcus sp. CT_GayMR19]TFV76773.1 phosphodiesterase [Blastococcus sp. CT_GayMR19]
MADLPGTAGRLVGLVLGALARLRGGRPMHPRGAVFSAVLERHGNGAGDPVGVPWLDAPATDVGVVRLSRGAGLPAPLPDLLGLAIRLPSATDAPIDLLLSTTGRGRLTRLLPALRRDAAAVYSSIMGYRSDVGTLRIAALPESDGVPSEPEQLAEEVPREGLSFTLAAARGRGPWVPFGRLVLGAPAEPLDPGVRFDAVLNPPPGLVPDGPMARFRAPAYARARAAHRA